MKIFEYIHQVFVANSSWTILMKKKHSRPSTHLLCSEFSEYLWTNRERSQSVAIPFRMDSFYYQFDIVISYNRAGNDLQYIKYNIC